MGAMCFHGFVCRRCVDDESKLNGGGGGSPSNCSRQRHNGNERKNAHRRHGSTQSGFILQGNPRNGFNINMATNVLQPITFKFSSVAPREAGRYREWTPRLKSVFIILILGHGSGFLCPCTACWQSPPNFSSVWVRCGWRVIPFIYLRGLSECCAAILKGSGDCTLGFLWLNCALCQF